MIKTHHWPQIEFSPPEAKNPCVFHGSATIFQTSVLKAVELWLMLFLADRMPINHLHSVQARVET